MHYLIDADSIIYKAGCSVEERHYVVRDGAGQFVNKFQYKKDLDAWLEELEAPPVLEVNKEKNLIEEPFVAMGRATQVVDKILTQPDCTSYTMYLSGKGNYRKDMYPDYKEHRDPFDRPILEHEIRDYLTKKYNAILTVNEEADDIVSYEQMLNPKKKSKPTCIASIDKDLNNTPGWHYNYDKDEKYFVGVEEADLNFYRQLLTGDSTDLKGSGIPGIGKKKAESILPKYMEPKDMYATVRDAYTDNGLTEADLLKTAQCLYIRRAPEEIWIPPS